MMMEHQERTLEKVLNATTLMKKESKDDQKDWIEDQKMKAIDLEEVTDIEGENSAIKCGD